jgi:hypothetical protein
MVIYPSLKTSGLPRMADYALWCEAIARAMRYKENEFLKAYKEIRGTQNNEIVDSNPLGFVIKKFVESTYNSYEYSNPTEFKGGKITLFNGSPLRLLQELNPIATNEGIDITQKDWPKTRNWLIRKINIVKPTLKQTFGIEIEVDRDSTNSSIIRIEKSISGISGGQEISPERGNLSPYFEDMSPEKGELSPATNPSLSTISTNIGDTGYTGDNKAITDKKLKEDELTKPLKENVLEKEARCKESLDNDPKALDNRTILPSNNERIETDFMIYLDSRKEMPKIDSSTMTNDPYVGYKNPFFYCKKHPNIRNIHYEEIVDHLKLSNLHKKRDLEDHNNRKGWS